MVKSSADLFVVEEIKDRYRLKLEQWPGLAQRIIGHVDEGRSLVEGISLPLDTVEVHLVTHLARFHNADAARQALMVDLARQHLAELRAD